MNDIFVSALHSIPCVFFRMFEMRWKWIILEVQIFNLNQARKNLFHGLNGLVHILAQMHIGHLQTEMISKVSRYFKTYYQDISKNAIKVQFYKWKVLKHISGISFFSFLHFRNYAYLFHLNARESFGMLLYLFAWMLSTSTWNF